MFSFHKENHMNHLITLIFILTGLSFINSTQLSFTEGGQAEILFHYNQKQDLEIALRIGDRSPFYQNGAKEERGLSPGQYKRFYVDIEKHTALGVSYHMFLVRIKIENVSREDAGTYTSSIYRNDVIVDEYTKKVGLNIEFPPGKADCVVGPSHVDTTNRIWAHLKCTASIGNHPGLIECYQNGERVPPWTRPIQNRTTLLQTLWIRRATPIFCCSSTFDKESDMCGCKDFVKDFSHSNDDLDIQPCPLSTTSSREVPTTKNHKKMSQTPDKSFSKNADDAGDPMDTVKTVSTDSIPLESGLALSIILVFTVLNTFGISIMIVINSFRNHIKINTTGIRNLLKDKDTPIISNVTKEDTTIDPEQKKRQTLRNRNSSSRDSIQNMTTSM